MGKVRLEEVDAQITWRQKTTAKYIVTRLIMELYEEMKRQMGSWS